MSLDHIHDKSTAVFYLPVTCETPRQYCLRKQKVALIVRKQNPMSVEYRVYNKVSLESVGQIGRRWVVKCARLGSKIWMKSQQMGAVAYLQKLR